MDVTMVLHTKISARMAHKAIEHMIRNVRFIELVMIPYILTETYHDHEASSDVAHAPSSAIFAWRVASSILNRVFSARSRSAFASR